MPQQPGRNDLCPCGSGKKMKACHPAGYGVVSKNRNVLLIGIGVAVVAVTAMAMLRQDQTPPAQAGSSRPMTSPATTPPTQNPAMPANQGTPGAQQPPGPAPEGKVWSTEHGHWHDDPGATPASPGAKVTPEQTQALQMPVVQNPNQTTKAPVQQPPGPAPEGKVWSTEHGHWHDAPKTPAPAPSQGSGPK